ncbi:hypothetical protein CROQUDRAFT_99871 [Cronartium quercuum f. sp. fusiforme G11]|uniref:Brl1/Brr6 domain-containing protein n=1 Tax=Cronartium quercuum f. sp. fusiforme G11 TaxID=708437 RepID=A0A9P6NBB2_9BASI|nr:hypothetical protein CROQUDRAFT_99871 [Cronartium quercuum f. sp. fusiforme G11]
MRRHQTFPEQSRFGLQAPKQNAEETNWEPTDRKARPSVPSALNASAPLTEPDAEPRICHTQLHRHLSLSTFRLGSVIGIILLTFGNNVHERNTSRKFELYQRIDLCEREFDAHFCLLIEGQTKFMKTYCQEWQICMALDPKTAIRKTRIVFEVAIW